MFAIFSLYSNNVVCIWFEVCAFYEIFEDLRVLRTMGKCTSRHIFRYGKSERCFQATFGNSPLFTLTRPYKRHQIVLNCQHSHSMTAKIGIVN